MGWSLVFLSDPGGLIDSQTGRPADLWSHVYFAGCSYITLGLGDYRPTTVFLKVMTVLAAFNGFVLVTLAISYLLPVLSAAVEQRTTAFHISVLGDTPAAAFQLAWNGEDVEALSSPLTGLVPKLSLLAERHLAYPVLHYFMSARRETAIAPNLALLDDILVIAEVGIKDKMALSPIALRPAERAIHGFLGTIGMKFIGPASDVPPAPDLTPLREAGIDCVSDQVFLAAIEKHQERRRLLNGLLAATGWNWEEAVGKARKPESTV